MSTIGSSYSTMLPDAIFIVKSRILRDDSKARSQIMDSYLRDINAIHYDSPSCWLNHSKKSSYESSLPTSCSANNTNFMSRLKCTGNPVKNKRRVSPISDLHSVN
ncbi:hypothetical protein Leryth_016244 [Lithospermum erythrorhizon]|nr:hypothetical protein Leryth_016244 [Lithospermum erythrorhizon]